MTTPVFSVSPETTAAEVLTQMYERGIHHVPVVGPEGELVGMITDTDLLGLELRTPFILKSELERAARSTKPSRRGPVSRRCSCRSCRRRWIRSTSRTRSPSRSTRYDAASSSSRSTTSEILLARGRGSPSGSEARQEQGLATDQDNALVVECERDEFLAVDPYFERLATIVNDGIERSGSLAAGPVSLRRIPVARDARRVGGAVLGVDP